MCGITGFLDPESRYPELNLLVARMAATLAHRGPDDSGTWVDSSAGIALGFQRLAILDLSPAGHQPMLSADGRYVIVYNGEVYNYRLLGEELEQLGHRFRGHSDTEVMLAAICQWGLEAATRRFNGMFAFALWDRNEQTLFLVRDRLGIKPLYYGWQNGVFLFGSELKALQAHPAFQPQVDRNALTLYLRYNYVPAPFSIYTGICKLSPGTILRLDRRQSFRTPELRPYWSAREAAEAGVQHPFTGTEDDAVEALETLLRAAVRERMIADVPLGAFLSGGIDSSLIVSLMQSQSTRPVQTFTIGFQEAGFSEAECAREIARHLQTDHTELYVTPEEARNVIPRLPRLYDEPFADASQIPTFLVAQLARRHVTVALSGDGGDELFGGYNRYFWTRRLWRGIGWMPHPLRRAGAGLVQRIPSSVWTALLAGRFIPARRRLPNPADKAHKTAELLKVSRAEEVYLDLVSQWKEPAEIVVDGNEPATLLTDRRKWAKLPDPVLQMMFLDLVTYLPDDILVKVDRASMGVSLEARAPYLDDYRLVEFAWSLPLRLKVRGGTGKWILRRVLYRTVPPRMIERPKMGFGVPIGDWLRGPLREWAEAYLDEKLLEQQGYFHPAPIRQKWTEHLQGGYNWQYLLWSILMFQAWLAENVGHPAA